MWLKCCVDELCQNIFRVITAQQSVWMTNQSALRRPGSCWYFAVKREWKVQSTYLNFYNHSWLHFNFSFFGFFLSWCVFFYQNNNNNFFVHFSFFFLWLLVRQIGWKMEKFVDSDKVILRKCSAVKNECVSWIRVFVFICFRMIKKINWYSFQAI